MNVIREIYDFITGGSVVAPVGLACAIIFALSSASMHMNDRAAWFIVIVVLTLLGATLEKVR